MNYLSTTTFESKLLPGVQYTLRKMSQGRRRELNIATAQLFQRIQELERDRNPLVEEIDRARQAAMIEPCSCDHPVDPVKDSHDPVTKRCTMCHCREPKPDNDAYGKLAAIDEKRLEMELGELAPVYVQWGVSAIEGLVIDGQPATVGTFLDKIPEEAIFEISREIMRVSRMTFDEQMGFRSPSTSGAPVDGAIPNSVAPPAANSSSTSTPEAPIAA